MRFGELGLWNYSLLSSAEKHNDYGFHFFVNVSGKAGISKVKQNYTYLFQRCLYTVHAEGRVNRHRRTIKETG